jgi:hypothetical protein
MHAYTRGSGASGLIGSLVMSLIIVGCTASLPQGGTGTGGAGAITGITGTGGISIAGSAPMLHRATATACSGELAEAGVTTSPFTGASPGPAAPDGGAIACAADSDCPPCANGQLDHCFAQSLAQPPLACVCDQCNTDQDCGASGVCACNQTGWGNSQVGNLCILAGNCRVDADCGPGGFCSPSPANCGAGGYYCHTATDTCLDDADCLPPTACAYSPAAGAWACTTSACGGG